MARKQLENSAIKAALKWFQLQYPRAFDLVVKIDNEGTSNRAQAVACGLHVGASDLLIALPLHGYGGLWLEAKRDHWKLTKSQIPHVTRQWDFIDKMRSVGYAGEFCIGVDELIIALREYMKNGRINVSRREDIL
jgi:hypothetical protein